MTVLSIPEMSCGHCKATVEKTIRALDPAAALHFDMEARRVTVGSVAALPAMQSVLAAAGYAATVSG